VDAHYESVDHPKKNCVTVVLWTKGEAECGRVIGPTKMIFGQDYSIRSPLERHLSARGASRMGINFAQDLGVDLVVVDPEHIWKRHWGILHSPEPVLRAQGAPAP
jgi:hypothetical protein